MYVRSQGASQRFGPNGSSQQVTMHWSSLVARLLMLLEPSGVPWWQCGKWPRIRWSTAHTLESNRTNRRTQFEHQLHTVSNGRWGMCGGGWVGLGVCGWREGWCWKIASEFVPTRISYPCKIILSTSVLHLLLLNPCLSLLPCPPPQKKLWSCPYPFLILAPEYPSPSPSRTQSPIPTSCFPQIYSCILWANQKTSSSLSNISTT